jgi:hypothetical protein
MMHWDYRVFFEDGGYTIRTVYYADFIVDRSPSQ